MNRTVSLAILGISAVALGACAQAQPAQPAGQPQAGATAQVPGVSDVLQNSRLADNIRAYLLQQIESRKA